MRYIKLKNGRVMQVPALDALDLVAHGCTLASPEDWVKQGWKRKHVGDELD